MHDRFYPGADAKTQWRGSGGITMSKIDKLLLHTTETRSWPSYPTFAPTLTFNPFAPRGRRWRQHYPINGSASTLKNSGGYRPNRANVCQIEIIAYCDPRYADSAAHISKITADAYHELAEFWVWLSQEWEVPIKINTKWKSYPASYGLNNGIRLTPSQFSALEGLCGHQHAPGNTHGDPGALDVNLIYERARQISNPDPVDLEHRMINLNARWPGFSSTPDVPAWASRCESLASLIKESGATIAVIQEIGKDESVDMYNALGDGWSWQRATLNAIFWRKDTWAIKDAETDDQSRDFMLSSFGQLQRTLIICKLINHSSNQVLYAAGSHLAAAASDLSPELAKTARVTQAREIAQHLASYHPVIFGADLNNPNLTSGPRKVLRDAGFNFEVDQVRLVDAERDRKDGIDAVADKGDQIKIKSARVLSTGDASDHDARVVTFGVT